MLVISNEVQNYFKKIKLLEPSKHNPKFTPYFTRTTMLFERRLAEKTMFPTA